MLAGLAAILCLSAAAVTSSLTTPYSCQVTRIEPGHRSRARRFVMTRNANIALALCCGAARHGHRGTGGRCQYVRGSIAETRISLGHGTGQISGHCDWRVERRRHGDLAQRAAQRLRSLDIFVTKSGDVLRTEGLPTRTPIPGAPPGEFTVTRGPGYHWGMGQVRRSVRHDGIRRTGSHPRCPANHRFRLQGDRVRSEHQSRSELTLSSDFDLSGSESKGLS